MHAVVYITTQVAQGLGHFHVNEDIFEKAIHVASVFCLNRHLSVNLGKFKILKQLKNT